MVQSCIPKSVKFEDCHKDGQFIVVIGQEVYADSPFTKHIEQIMDDDVMSYYAFIVIIFLVIKLFLFIVLWSWLKIRVTQRMMDLS